MNRLSRREKKLILTYIRIMGVEHTQYIAKLAEKSTYWIDLYEICRSKISMINSETLRRIFPEQRQKEYKHFALARRAEIVAKDRQSSIGEKIYCEIPITRWDPNWE